jgi:hypothetical protein
LLSKDRAFHADYIRRNVMWLMKHGLVKPEDPAPIRKTGC